MKGRRHLPSDGREPQHSFTILELLVAAAITVLIAGLVLSLTSSALRNWSRSQGAFTADSQARLVLDRLAQDFRGVLCREDGKVWLAATVQSAVSVSGAWVNGTKPVTPSLNPAAANLVDARFGVAGIWLRFFTLAQGADSRTNDPAAPIAVSYQLIRRSPTPSGENCHYLLYRAAITPSETFAAGYDLSGSSYTTANDDDGAAGNVTRPGLRQVIADNVIDFGVHFFGYAPDLASGAPVLQRIFPVDGTDLDFRARSPSTAGEAGMRFPAVADVLVRVLTDEGARQIAALESGQITGDWWAIAEADSKVFTRRILINAGSF
jgi:hypothetical protein